MSLGWSSISFNWWPHSLVIGQVFFALAALTVLIGCAYATKVAGRSSLVARVGWGYLLSAVFVAFCTYSITVIQIHKHGPISDSGFTLKQAFTSLEGGSSIGTFNASNDTMVAVGNGDGKALEFDNSNLARVKVNGMDSCVGGIEDWPCFVLIEKSHIEHGDRSGFEESALNFERVLRLRLLMHQLRSGSKSQDLATQCFTEFNAEMGLLRQEFDKRNEADFYNVLSRRPVCLGESPSIGDSHK